MSVQGAMRFIGASVTRVEDARILTGRGRYVDDLRLPGMLHAAFVRSPIPHGRVVSVDAERARELPGVVAVVTAEEIAASTAPMQVHMEVPGYLRPAFRPLALDKVRHVGDPVVLVIAESRYLAEDGRDLVEVEYEPLAPVANAEQALDPARPVLFEDVGSNVLYREERSFGDPDAAFAAAHAIVRDTFRLHRVGQVPMETRGGVADYDPGTEELTYHATTQAPHNHKLTLAGILGHPADRLRVIAPDVGGAFGQKGFVSREDVAVCFAAKRLGRPVKWMEDRVENLTAAQHAREETVEMAAAVSADGSILALDVRMTLDQGAYPNPLPPVFIGWIIRTMLPGPYRIEHVRWEQTQVATNKATYGFYRGPWAVESLVREVIVDRIAAELGLDPVEVRRRNLVRLDEQPRAMATGATLEGVAALDSLERAADLIGYDALRDEQRRAREAGRLLGIGFATFIEPAPGPPNFGAAAGLPEATERAVALLEPDGHLTVITSQAPHGQSHETTLAQVAASELGVPLDHVRVVHGDTANTPFSILGTAGSRSATMASGATLHATRSVKQKALELAGHLLEVAPEDLEIVNGLVSARGAPTTAIPLAQVAAVSYFAPPEGEEEGLRSSSFFTPPRGGFSGGTHVCVVEIDPETGVLTIPRYLVVEDCGRLINPAVVEGQVRGGVAQGIGLTLLEHALYDEDGNFLAGTFMDYLVPTAMEVPSIEIDHLESQPLDEVDFRGVGEGGTIAAPPAIMNAVSDALGGVPVSELPLTPERILDLIDASRAHQPNPG